MKDHFEKQYIAATNAEKAYLDPERFLSELDRSIKFIVLRGVNDWYRIQKAAKKFGFLIEYAGSLRVDGNMVVIDKNKKALSDHVNKVKIQAEDEKAAVRKA